MFNWLQKEDYVKLALETGLLTQDIDIRQL